MLGVLEFAAKDVFGKGFPDPYTLTNLGAVRIIQGKLNLSHVFLFEEGPFPEF